MKFQIKVQDLLTSYKEHIGSPVFLCMYIKNVYLPKQSFWHRLYLSFCLVNDSPLKSLIEQYNGDEYATIINAFRHHPDFKDVPFSPLISLHKHNRILFLERLVELHPNATITARY
jgi:hypothetical protein